MRGISLRSSFVVTTRASLSRRFLGGGSACDSCPSCRTGCFRFGLGPVTCPSCGRVHSGASEASTGHVDYFALLGVERKFRVDLKTAEYKYKRLQFLVHPDRGADSGDHCALLNAAIATLKDPVQRAEHLLQLHGVPETSESDRMHNPELLMEIMELNETIDEATGNRAELEKILEAVRGKLESSEQTISDLYEKQDLDKVKLETDNMKFFARTVERLQSLLRY